MKNKLIWICSSGLLAVFIFCNQFPSDTTQTIPAGPIYLNDHFEPNNQRNQAILISSDTLKNAICIPSEYDWYKIPIDSNTKLTITIQSPKISSLKINICSSDSVIPGDKKENESILSFSHFFTKRDTILCSIFNNNSNSSNAYELFIKKSTQLATDTSEPNNWIYTAKLISDSQVTSFITPSNDTDWFKIPVSKREIITTTILKESAEGIIETNLYDSKKVKFTGTYSNGATSYNCISSNYDTCYLQIYNNKTEVVSPLQYTIKIKRSPWIDDHYEYNNTKLKAALLLPGKIDSLYAFSTDIDYFKITTDSSMYIEATIYPHPKPSISGLLYFNMELSTTELIDTFTRLPDSLQLKYVTKPHDTVFFSILNRNTGEDNGYLIPYSLELKSIPITVFDSLEPNNSRSEATLVGNQILKSNLITTNDTDWYQISLLAGQTARVCITGSSQIHRFTSLFTTFYNQSISGITSGDSTIYQYAADKNETCYIKIQSYYNTKYSISSIPYSISINKTNIPVDRFEDNNSKMTATSLIPQKYDSLSISNKDLDYFKFSTDSARYIEINLVSANIRKAYSEFELSLEDAAQVISKSFNNYSDTVKLFFVTKPEETYYLKVSLPIFSDTIIKSHLYSLQLKSFPIIDDSLEDNDTITKAKKITDTSYTLFYLDQDWFSIDIAREETIRFESKLVNESTSSLTMFLYEQPFMINKYENFCPLSYDKFNGFSYTGKLNGTIYILIKSADFAWHSGGLQYILRLEKN